jgi:hypothetical protein
LRSCLQLLQLHGIFCWRQNQGAIPRAGGGYRKFVGLKGVSDIIGVVPFKPMNEVYGIFFAVEVKKPGGRLSKHQKAFLRNVTENGGLAVCVDDVKQLEAWLKEQGLIERLRC